MSEYGMSGNVSILVHCFERRSRIDKKLVYMVRRVRSYHRGLGRLEGQTVDVRELEDGHYHPLQSGPFIADWIGMGAQSQIDVLRHAQFTLEQLLPLIPETVDEQYRTGGVLTLMDRITGNVVLQAVVGMVRVQQVAAFYRISREKAERLYLTHKYAGHTSSGQSAEEDLGRYAGAIVANGWIVSFSGLPAKADWALALDLATCSQMMTRSDAHAIATRDCDEYFGRLQSKMIASG